MKSSEREVWSERVFADLQNNIQKKDHVIFLAGKLYRQYLKKRLIAEGVRVSVPMRGLGIGQQLRFMKSLN